ncbi:MAG: class I SAM-dependent methyltransferase, partial [Acidobacteria bacterium]|nr:class I SAM-dependent methyltransferase [Acidobacteriota bacterium]
GLVDAAVAYALVRERRPGLVVEVGGGFSSRVLRTALDAGGGGGRLVTIDPEPRADLTGVVSEHRKERVEDVPLAFFEELPPDSVLFIDSSHRAGTGSDVNFLFLEVLPALAPGVLVHVHDVFLPEDYPFEWNASGPFYTEQYLLHALLLFSRGFRVVWPGRQMLRERPALLEAALGPGVNLGLHGSFWLERKVSAPEAFLGPEG